MMTSRAFPPLLLATVALLLAGCLAATPATQYIQLDAEGAELGSRASPRVLVEAVHMPDYLLRAELTRRIDGNQLGFDARFRWAEPLDLAVQRIVTLQLSEELDSAGVTAFPKLPPGGADWRVTLLLRHLEPEHDKVRLVADIRLQRERAVDDDPVTLHHEAEAALAPERHGGGAIAASMSDLLAGMAAEIATLLRAEQGNHWQATSNKQPKE
jgi:uncharacterized lipoprotein YmbA